MLRDLRPLGCPHGAAQLGVGRCRMSPSWYIGVGWQAAGKSLATQQLYRLAATEIGPLARTPRRRMCCSPLRVSDPIPHQQGRLGVPVALPPTCPPAQHHLHHKRSVARALLLKLRAPCTFTFALTHLLPSTSSSPRLAPASPASVFQLLAPFPSPHTTANAAAPSYPAPPNTTKHHH
jgi:hypothetical protein